MHLHLHLPPLHRHEVLADYLTEQDLAALEVARLTQRFPFPWPELRATPSREPQDEPTGSGPFGF